MMTWENLGKALTTAAFAGVGLAALAGEQLCKAGTVSYTHLLGGAGLGQLGAQVGDVDVDGVVVPHVRPAPHPVSYTHLGVVCMPRTRFQEVVFAALMCFFKMCIRDRAEGDGGVAPQQQHGRRSADHQAAANHHRPDVYKRQPRRWTWTRTAKSPGCSEAPDDYTGIMGPAAGGTPQVRRSSVLAQPKP